MLSKTGNNCYNNKNKNFVHLQFKRFFKKTHLSFNSEKIKLNDV